MPDNGGKSNLGLRVSISVILIVVFLAGGAGVLAKLASLREPPTRDATPPPRTAVRVAHAARTTYQEKLTGFGRARALLRTRVAAELGATVEWISPKLEAGNTVSKDEVVVRLDARNARTTLARAEANLARSRADVARLEAEFASLAEQIGVATEELDSAERELQRARSLARQGHAPASDVDTRSMAEALRRAARVGLQGRKSSTAAQIDAARAGVEAAEADRDRAADDLARTEVRAPFDGSVEVRLVDPGAYVGPGQELFELVDLSKVEVPVALPASRFRTVAVGADASIRMYANAEPAWTGQVARVAPVVDPETRTFLAYLLVESDSGRAIVPPGAFVLAEVAGERHADVFVVPRSAFVSGRLFIAEADGDEAVVQSRIPSVHRLLIDVALLDGGLEDGEAIVVTNVEQIDDGSRVRVVIEQGAER